MALIDDKIVAFSSLIASLPIRPNADGGLTADELQEYWDESSEELRIALNNVIDRLASALGAGDLGATAVSGGTAETVQGILDELATMTIKTSGDQTIGGVKTFTSSPVVPTPTTSTQAAQKAQVDAVDDELTTHKSSGDHDDRYYTDDEVDAFTVKLTGDQSVDGVKTFVQSPVVPTPTSPSQPATKGYVDSSIGAVVLGQIPDDSLTLAKVTPDFRAQVEAPSPILVESASVTDTYTATVPEITAYYDGLTIWFRPTAVGNTGTSSVDINGFGAVTFKRLRSGVVGNLIDGDMLQNGEYLAIYQSSPTGFLIVNPSTAFVELNTVDTLTNKTLTTPTISTPIISTPKLTGGYVSDANDNEIFSYDLTPSAVNQVKIKNAITGGLVGFQADGGDTNIDIEVTPKGTGRLLSKGKLVYPQKLITLASYTANLTSSWVDIPSVQFDIVAGSKYRLSGFIDSTWISGSGGETSIYLSSGSAQVGGIIASEYFSGTARSTAKFSAIGAVGLVGSMGNLGSSTYTAGSSFFDCFINCITTGVLKIAYRSASSATSYTIKGVVNLQEQL